MSDTPAHTSEAPEVRDADEIAEYQRQGAIAPLPNGWPQDANGNYLAIVTGAASDKIPTVQFGNVVIGPVMIQRPIVSPDLQGIIDGARETQRAAEYVVGAERRLLQWALDPASKIQSPITGQDAFAAPPPGYDPTKLADPQAPPAAPPVAPQTQGDVGTPSA